MDAAKQVLARHGSGGLNINHMRPFLDNKGRSCVIVNGKVYTVQEAGLRTNAGALLQYDEWKDIDREAVQVAVDRLVGIADLQSRGLTYNLGSIGVTESLWHESSDMTGASFSMDGRSRGEKDREAYNNRTVPVPIVHKEFEIGIRELEAARRFGRSLDLSHVAIASRKVAEASEDMLFAGAPVVVNGNPIYGYTTQPNRNLKEMATAWNSVAQADNGLIVEEVSDALQTLRNDRYFGPYVMYIPGAYEGKLDEDYAANYPKTLRQRLLELSGLSEIKVADRLMGDNVVIVSMQRDVVDLAIAQDITTVQWTNNGGMSEEFKVMAVWAPRIKNDYDNKSGIVHIRPGAVPTP